MITHIDNIQYNDYKNIPISDIPFNITSPNITSIKNIIAALPNKLPGIEPATPGTSIVYLTINTLNNKFYVGVHKVTGYNHYLGSGIALNNAIKKYSREVFKRITLYVFTSHNEAYDKEKEIVTEDLVRDKECYNICGGGNGSGEGETNSFFGKKHTKESLQKISDSKKGDNHPFFGKKHTKESLQKMSDSKKGDKNGRSKKCIVKGKEFTTINQASDHFNVSRYTIRRWINDIRKPESYFI